MQVPRSVAMISYNTLARCSCSTLLLLLLMVVESKHGGHREGLVQLYAIYYTVGTFYKVVLFAKDL